MDTRRDGAGMSGALDWAFFLLFFVFALFVFVRTKPLSVKCFQQAQNNELACRKHKIMKRCSNKKRIIRAKGAECGRGMTAKTKRMIRSKREG